MAWALLAARKLTTPLFFSRPYGGGGENSQFPNLSQLGDEGDPLYKDDSVAAVNLFRNAMVGEDEYLRNPNGDTNVLMIERGNKGIAIINLKYEEYDINSETNLAEGEYENHTINTNKFKVADGKITGSLSPRSVTVLYNQESEKASIAEKDVSSSAKSINTGMMMIVLTTIVATLLQIMI